MIAQRRVPCNTDRTLCAADTVGNELRRVAGGGRVTRFGLEKPGRDG